jgi:hypothetical protein
MVDAIAAPSGMGVAALAGMTSSARGTAAGDKMAISPPAAHATKPAEFEARAPGHRNSLRHTIRASPRMPEQICRLSAVC